MFDTGKDHLSFEINGKTIHFASTQSKKVN